MTYLEIYKAIADITKEKCIECKNRLDMIPKENSTERKAVQLEYGIYNFCSNAGLLYGSDSTKAEECLKKRKVFIIREIHKYPGLSTLYQSINEEEKMRFVSALQAEIFIRDQWLGVQYAELSKAEASGDFEKAFELKIKIGASENMFAVWEKWRIENNVYPNMFNEVIK